MTSTSHPISCWIPQEEIQRLDTIAKRRKWSRSQLLRGFTLYCLSQGIFAETSYTVDSVTGDLSAP